MSAWAVTTLLAIYTAYGALLAAPLLSTLYGSLFGAVAMLAVYEALLGGRAT